MAGLSNKEIAGVFKEIEVLLRVVGEDESRAIAYGRISRILETLPESAADLAAAGALDQVRGIGPKVQAAVAELVDTGTCRLRDDLAGRLAPGVIEILRLPGLGPKRVHSVVSELGVESLEELQAAATDGRLASLKGFGAKSAQRVMDGIAFLARTRGKMRISDAWAMAAHAAEELGIEDATLTGPMRRGVPLSDTVSIVAAGDPRESRDVPRGARPALRIRFAAEKDLARAIFQETGPEEHVAAVLARPGADGTEQQIYASRGLHHVPPERRHACDGTQPLPRLVERGDLRGMVHTHTTWSDGQIGVGAMAGAARERGYAYLGVTDHSPVAVYANGVTLERLERMAAEIAAFNRGSSGFTVLHGTEVDILPDGSLDYPDEVLSGLDFVIASVHSSFTQDQDSMTERIIKAVRHPHVDILGHMTGRLLLRRGPYALDVERVLEAAAEAGTCIELNANPWRLDLDPSRHFRAVELGIGVPIGPDAHSAGGMDFNQWGVLAARHGGLRARDVPNTGDAGAFLEAIGR